MTINEKICTSTVNVKSLGTQSERMQKSLTLDNKSTATTSPFLLKRASLPLNFELILSFWKTREKIQSFAKITQVTLVERRVSFTEITKSFNTLLIT